MDIMDDMGMIKLSAKVYLKVNYSFKFRICRAAKWKWRVTFM